jgi:hypothetical protein
MNCTLNRRLKWLLLGYLAACVTPFLLLCAYAHPSADDWYMAAAGEKLGVLGASKQWYLKLTGRFTQQALTSLHPIRWGIAAYQAWCLAVLLTLFLSIYLCIRRWLPDFQRWQWCAISGAVACVFLWQMPSPAQGIYWVNGLNTYIFAAILQLLLAVVLGPECVSKSPKYSPGSYALAMLLSILAVGCSEVAMSFQVMFLVMLGMFSFMQCKSVSPILVLTMACTAVATIVVFKAPGNDWRTSMYDNAIHGQLLPSLWLAARLSIARFASWASSAPLALLSLFLLSFWRVKTADRRSGWLLLVFATLLLTGTLWGGFFVGAWSAGKSLPPRAINLIYLFFVLEWIILLHAIAVFLKARDLEPPRLNRTAIFVVVLGLYAALASPGNVRSAWRDLIKGDAGRFSRESQARFELIRSSSGDDITVPALKTKPKMLFFNDFKPDPDDWRNKGAAEFFNKKVIRLNP